MDVAISKIYLLEFHYGEENLCFSWWLLMSASLHAFFALRTLSILNLRKTRPDPESANYVCSIVMEAKTL